MSPKLCPKCGIQGDCINTRQTPQHVTRRYECGCDFRWTTREVKEQELKALKEKAKRYEQVRGLLGDSSG